MEATTGPERVPHRASGRKTATIWIAASAGRTHWSGNKAATNPVRVKRVPGTLHDLHQAPDLHRCTSPVRAGTATYVSPHWLAGIWQQNGNTLSKAARCRGYGGCSASASRAPIRSGRGHVWYQWQGAQVRDESRRAAPAASGTSSLSSRFVGCPRAPSTRVPAPGAPDAGTAAVPSRHLLSLTGEGCHG